VDWFMQLADAGLGIAALGVLVYVLKAFLPSTLQVMSTMKGLGETMTELVTYLRTCKQQESEDRRELRETLNSMNAALSDQNAMTREILEHTRHLRGDYRDAAAR